MPTAIEANRIAIGVTAFLFASLGAWNLYLTSRINEQAAVIEEHTNIIGEPVIICYDRHFWGTPYKSVQTDDTTCITPTLWQIADSYYYQLDHLAPMTAVSEETLIRLADVDALEMKLLGEDSFWNFYRTEWMTGDLDGDGILNRIDDCPEIPAPGDPLPVHLQTPEAQATWSAEHRGRSPYDPNAMRGERQRYQQDYAWYSEAGWTRSAASLFKPREPEPDEARNLYYGCPEESDDDDDGVANYRDRCENTLRDEVANDYHVVRGPQSLFPPDQGCSASQVTTK